MKIYLRQHTNFYKFSLSFMILMLIDCFITPSAYSALHSGRVGSYMSSTTFTISPAYILLLCALFAFVADSRFYKKNVAYGLCHTILLSGLINRGLLKDLKTYLYDVISILVVSTIAISDVLRKNAGINESVGNWSIYDSDYKMISKIMLILFFIGLALVYIAPGRFGVLYFQFSRSARGEVTIWNLFFVSVFLLIIAINKSSKKEKAKLYWIIAFTACFITISTSSRTMALLYLICAFLAWIKQKFDVKKVIGLALIVIVVLFGFNYLLNYFFLGQQLVSGSLEMILNGRFGLWSYYWDLFVSHPIFGYGQVSISEQLRKTLGGASEIGILKNATNYGIIFVIIELYVIIKGVTNSLNVIKGGSTYDSFDHMMFFLFWCNFPLIFQQHARILNYADFIFWYSSVYMFYRNFKLRTAR